MNTSFWGKDGWKLTHSIAYSYDEKNAVCYRTFFNSIQHILPCIYCRRSYKKYITLYPVQTHSKRSLTKWLYIIHNCVNDKLRHQGYLTNDNPSLREVDTFYEDYIRSINCMTGIDFLYCVVFNYNLEISETRKRAYIRFFHCLQYILPNEKIRSIYQAYLTANPFEECLQKVEKTQSLSPLKKWMYNLEKCTRKRCCSYKSRCKKIEDHRVKKCTGDTCRKSTTAFSRKAVPKTLRLK